VKFLGRATANDLSPEIKDAVEETNIDIDGFLCFELPLFDLSSGREIGVGVDCLNPFNADGDDAGDGLQLEAKTFFFLRRGTIVNHGCTSVRPFFAGVGDGGVTHMTGSIPPSEFGVEPNQDAPPVCTAAGGIIYTDRGFKNSEGTTRLSGAVNLSEVDQGVITFSCAFVIALDPPFPHLSGKNNTSRSRNPNR